MLELAHQYLLFEAPMLAIACLIALVACLVHDVLLLRLCLAGAALLLAGFALRVGSDAATFWAVVFVAINALHVRRLLRDRSQASLGPEQRRAYRQVFWIMWPSEFRRLWRRGREIRRRDGRLCTAGEVPHNLYLVQEGHVSIERGGRPIARLGPMQLVGEMSFICRGAAMADAVVREPVRLYCWSRDELDRLERTDPALLARLHVVIGQDLVRKLTGPEEVRRAVTGTLQEPVAISPGVVEPS